MRISPISGAMAGTALLLIGMQFIAPAKTNPPEPTGHTLQDYVPVPQAVADILKRSCNDCHSNQTRWPWYSSVAPVSWLVAYDVNHGRRKMNFSQWDAPFRGRSQNTGDRLGNICTLVSSRAMPIPAYSVVHPQARLSPEDIRAICDWTRQASPPR